MDKLVIGNIIGLIGSILMVLCGLTKERKKTIIIQTLQIILLSVSDLILGSVTGFIINVISILRNVLSYYNKLNITWMSIIIILSGVLTIFFNNLGIIGYLPFINSAIFTVFMNLKDDIKFKVLMIVSMTLWLIHDIAIKAYTTAIFDILTIITSVFTIYKLKRKSS